MEGAVYADLADAADLCDLEVKFDRADPTEAVELYLWWGLYEGFCDLGVKFDRVDPTEAVGLYLWWGLYEDPYDLVEDFLWLLPDCG